MADWLNLSCRLRDFVYRRRHGEGGSHSTDYPHLPQKRCCADQKYLKSGPRLYLLNNDAYGYAENARSYEDANRSHTEQAHTVSSGWNQITDAIPAAAVENRIAGVTV
jgi:hypothetical protein